MNKTNEMQNLCLDIIRTNNLLIYGNTLISVKNLCERVKKIHNIKNDKKWTSKYINNKLAKANGNPLNSKELWKTYVNELQKVTRKKITGKFYPGEISEKTGNYISENCIILKVRDINAQQTRI